MAEFKIKMSGRALIKVSHIHHKVGRGDLQKDNWVTIGVVVHKTEPRQSASVCWLHLIITGLVAQLVASPMVVSSIPTGSHTFSEIYCKIFSTVILLLLIQEQLVSRSVCRKYWLNA